MFHGTGVVYQDYFCQQGIGRPDDDDEDDQGNDEMVIIRKNLHRQAGSLFPVRYRDLFISKVLQNTTDSPIQD